MGFFNNFPYTNFHELNLDWLLAKMKELADGLDAFVENNTMKYADPFDWNITTQYPANTVVKDNNTGKVYIAKQNVPPGVTIGNTDYWLLIGDTTGFQLEMDQLMSQIAAINEEDRVQASVYISQGTLFWLNDYLMEALTAINVGDVFDLGNNCDNVTIEDLLNRINTAVSTNTGNISSLTTAVNNLETIIYNNTLKNKKVVLISDSYGTGTGGIVGQGWCYYFDQYSGADCTALYGSGAGYVSTSNGNGNVPAGKTFVDMIDDAASGMSADDRKEVVMVICGGGINDAGQNPTSSVNSFITKARTNFPNAVVWCIPLQCDAIPTAARKLVYRYIFNAASSQGAQSYWNGIFWLVNNPSYGAGDGNHASDSGYQLMAHMIMSLVLGGFPESSAGPGGVSPATGFTSDYVCSFRKSNRVHIEFHYRYTGTMSGGATVANLNQTYWPAERVWVPVYLYSSGTRAMYMALIEASGTIKLATGQISGVNPTSISNPEVYGTFDYEIDNARS